MPRRLAHRPVRSVFESMLWFFFFFFYSAKRKEGDPAKEITQGHVGLGMRVPLEKAPTAAKSKLCTRVGHRQPSG